jgi:hypothetical protein
MFLLVDDISFCSVFPASFSSHLVTPYLFDGNVVLNDRISVGRATSQFVPLAGGTNIDI